MANQSTAERVWNLFSQPTPPQREAFLQNIEQVPEAARIPFFSDFDKTHMARVRYLLDRWNGLAQGNNEKGVDTVLDDFESLRGQENPDLLYFALEVFLTHYTGAGDLQIPSLMVREPELTAPSKNAEAGKFGPELAKGSEEETKMDWFREDPLLNEHHGHWHVVYDNSSVYDRQGEMFFYMHRQMLARYDAERLGLNIKRVVPFSDMGHAIDVGYMSGPDERLSAIFGRDREPKQKVKPNDAGIQRQLRTMINNDINNGVYDPQAGNRDEMRAETDAVNALGSTIESNASPQALDKPYNGYHGGGHMWIAGLNNGVMSRTTTAVRDVVFWEWHKEVDLHYGQLQDRLTPYEFHKDAPPVTLRSGSDDKGEPDSMDVIICNASSLPGWDTGGFDGAALGRQLFGNGSWDKDFPNGEISHTDANGKKHTIATTDTFITNRQFGSVTYERNGKEHSYDVEYLNHEAFCFFIRVENTSQQQKPVTVRIFLVPDSEKEDRTMWIELDKFLHELPPGRSVIYRPDADSSVIRKPALKSPAKYAVNYAPLSINDDPEEARCKCGWPYHLFLPRGVDSDTGAAYKLLVMMSDGEKDAIQSEEGCGSLSFCAARNNEYPDKRPLGYPFNRKFKGGIMDTVSTQPNFACRSVYIKHVTQ